MPTITVWNVVIGCRMTANSRCNGEGRSKKRLVESERKTYSIWGGGGWGEACMSSLILTEVGRRVFLEGIDNYVFWLFNPTWSFCILQGTRRIVYASTLPRENTLLHLAIIMHYHQQQQMKWRQRVLLQVDVQVREFIVFAGKKTHLKAIGPKWAWPFLAMFVQENDIWTGYLLTDNSAATKLIGRSDTSSIRPTMIEISQKIF